MDRRVVVIGGGAGGIVAANRLARRDSHLEVIVLDGHGDHIYQPGLLRVPLGGRRLESLTRDLHGLLDRRVQLQVERAAGIDPDARIIELEGGSKMPFDFLVLATGSRVDPDLIPGFRDAACHFHCQRRAVALAETLSAFRGGDLVVGATRLPYKCPVAPIEMALLLDEHLSRDGRRAKTRIHFVYPLPRASELEAVADLAESLFEERGIHRHTPFEVASIDPAGRVLHSSDGTRLPFDLLMLVPPHQCAPALRNSGLVGKSGFVPTDAKTLKVMDGIYAIGDNADLPVPKLASGAVLQAKTVVRNLRSELAGNSATDAYDGRTSCFIETGFGRTALVKTAYDRPPTLQQPNRLNTVRKRLINQFYFWRAARL
ncbi:MAG: FAD-dependent oxidoreductase [Planctomycetota bacterium]